MWKNQKKLTIENISDQYKKYYNVVFKYWSFLIIWIIAIIIFINLAQKTKQLNFNDNFLTEKKNLLWSINNYTVEWENDKINPIIIQWELKMQEKLFISMDNLIEYKWYILPKHVMIYDDTRLKSKEQLQSWYEQKDLELFINNIIFTKDDTKNNSTYNSLLPLDNSINETFYMSCIYSPKLLNFACNYFMNNFLENFFIYDLSTDYKWLNNIYYKIKWTKYEKPFCKWIEKYISSSKDTSDTLETLSLQCWEEYITKFNKIKLFLNVQEQLSNWYIKTNTTTDHQINEYKLISYQQLLYNDTAESIINEARFNTYVNYVISLLKKDNLVEPIYYDITYRINNNYIIPTLNTLKYKLTESKRQEAEKIISNIEILNKWNSLDWYVWLETKIINNNLKTQISLDDSDWNTTTSWDTQKEMQQLLNNIKHLSYLKIVNEEIAWNIIRISWYMTVKWIEKPIYFGANFKNTNWNLILLKIWITDYHELNEIITKMIENWNYTIMEIYEYIQKNIQLYMTADQPSLCDIIKWKTDSLWATLEKCSEKEILITTKKWITYDFWLKNYNIKSVSISDKEIENTINEILEWTTTNYNTIWIIIPEILTYTNTPTSNETDWNNTDVLISIWDITKYLWNNIIEIKKEWTVTSVEFIVNDITFIWNYNPTTKRLWPITIKEWDIYIRNFELYLNKNQQNKINEFTSDPIKFIQKINPEAAKQYSNL